MVVVVVMVVMVMVIKQIEQDEADQKVKWPKNRKIIIYDFEIMNYFPYILN